MVKTVEIKIMKNGKVILDFQGYTGEACIKDYEKIKEKLKGLGITVEEKEREEKPELYIKEEEREFVRF